jgi:hypothetical protein
MKHPIQIVDPSTVAMLQTLLELCPATKTARRSPELLIQEKLSEAVKQGEAVSNVGIETDFFTLYGTGFTSFTCFTFDDSRMLLSIAAAHDCLRLGIPFMIDNARTDKIRKSYIWQQSEAVTQWQDMARWLGHLFAKSRGWTPAKKRFNPSDLFTRKSREFCDGRYDVDTKSFPFLDHVQYFRTTTRPYKPIAMLTHSYEPAERIELYAVANGFNCELLPYSWHYPRRCVAALLTAKPNAMAE